MSATQLSTFVFGDLAGRYLTFSGRRMYRVLGMLPSATQEPEWYDVVMGVEPYFGMYGDSQEHEKTYAEVVKQIGSDPFYDEVIADVYMPLLVGGGARAITMRCRNPRISDGDSRIYRLEISCC